jgi:hypothetical protein
MGKLLQWPEKPKRKRRTREQIMADAYEMTVPQWRRWQMVRDNLRDKETVSVSAEAVSKIQAAWRRL